MRKGAQAPVRAGITVLLLAALVGGGACVLPSCGYAPQACAAVSAQQPAPSSLADVDVPEYSGDPSVALARTSGLDPAEAPVSLSMPELDDLGRPGAVSITASPQTMPAEGAERGSIGMIKPTGWRTVRDDSIDGKYLYNRCHLVAWCLSELNAEPRDLITGARYMNVQGMLPYEEEVARYIERTGGSVYYRVTPDFRGDDLVARGVRIQALSLSGDGVGSPEVDFDVYCYNVQPGFAIDYATGAAQKVE